MMVPHFAAGNGSREGPIFQFRLDPGPPAPDIADGRCGVFFHLRALDAFGPWLTFFWLDLSKAAQIIFVCESDASGHSWTLCGMPFGLYCNCTYSKGCQLFFPWLLTFPCLCLIYLLFLSFNALKEDGVLPWYFWPLDSPDRLTSTSLNASRF